MKKLICGYSIFNAKKDSTEYLCLHFAPAEMRNVIGLGVEQLLIREPRKYHESFTNSLLHLTNITDPLEVNLEYSSKGWLENIEFIGNESNE